MRTPYCALLMLLVHNTAFGGSFTLPFRNQSTALLQGYYYDDGTYHGGIDYACAMRTEIIAVEDGYAWSWSDDIYSSYSWGHYVAIYHPGSRTYSLYAHLDSWEPSIPRVYKSTHGGGPSVWVARGQRIGYSGRTGTIDPHLHFETSVNAIGGANRRDPYGLYTTHWSYPGCGNNGNNPYYWTVCPPVPYNSPYTCNGNPGPFVDIAKAGDFDGNRKYELVRFYIGCGKWSVALSNGSDFLPFAQWNCGLGINSVAQMIGDINGDNKDDTIVLQNNSAGDIYVSLSSGSSFRPYYNAGNNLMRNMTHRWVADVNGDNKDDLVGWANGVWYVSLSNGFTFGAQAAVRSASTMPTKCLLADVNGDNRADAVLFYSWGSWWVALGTASGGFSSWTNWDSGHGSGASDWHLADINGDRKADAIAYWNNQGSGWQGKIILHESTGSSFRGTNTPRAINHGTNSTKQLFGDFTGDGKADFGFYYPSTGWWVSRSDGWGFLPPGQW